MTIREKLQAIIENYINGNLSDCKIETKKLSVYEAMQLIQIWVVDYGADYDEAIENIKSLTA